MKKTASVSLTFVSLLCCAVFSALLFSGCDDDPDGACEKCSAAYAKEKKVKQIDHVDASNVLLEQFRFYYADNLIDSISKVNYNGADARTKEEVVSSLKLFYPSRKCIPSYYEERTLSASPVSLEKSIMSISGDFIVNKHTTFYPDEESISIDHTHDVDYTYNITGQVKTRHGSDFGYPIIWPSPYGNENFYTYTANNISKVVAQQEQAHYDLNKSFDTKNNPFNIQGGVLFYLNIIAYNDEEHFETISRDRNNVTEIIYTGTDTSNSNVTITYTFTYSYDAQNYPTSVHIYEVKDDDIYGGAETDHGTYNFEYY